MCKILKFLTGKLPILVLFYLRVEAQNNYLFENFTSEKGLSQNSCYSIAQDSDGMMWFGTQDGLNRFDGKEFTYYQPNYGPGKELPSNYISSLYFDKSKNLLWIGTLEGACIYDVYKDSLIGITKMYSSARLQSNVDIKNIIPGNQNEIWLVTQNYGLQQLNTKTNQSKTFFTEIENRKKVTGLVNFNGRIIVAIQNKLMVLNQAADTFEPLIGNISTSEIRNLYTYKNKLLAGTLSDGCIIIENPLQQDRKIINILSHLGGIGSFTEDNDSNLWIGTRGSGIHVYDSLFRPIAIASHESFNPRTLAKNFILSLFTDRQGLTWVGLSGGGVAKYDPSNYKFQNITNEKDNKNSLPDNMVFTLHRSETGIVYAGTQNNGIAVWQPDLNKFTKIFASSKNDHINSPIYDITEDEFQNLWIASWSGLTKINGKTRRHHYYHSPEILASSKLYSVKKLKNADSLFIVGENGFAFFSLKDNQWKSCKEDKLYSHIIGRYIFEDDMDIIWICTLGKGLISYDYKKNEYRTCNKVMEKSKNVRHLFRDGHLYWLSTDNGLVAYDFTMDTILYHILPGKNNQSNVCYAAEKDDNGNIWVSSNTGLYRISEKDLFVRNFYLDNGLVFPEYNTACITRLKNGAFLFGGVGGITKFFPDEFKDNTYSPAPVITRIKVNNLPWRPPLSIMHTNEFIFSYKQNFLTIYFAVPNFSIEGKQQFRYRLKGVSDQWSESIDLNFASYTQLKPGTYNFELQATNRSGVWSNEKTSIKITIIPPWWQSNLFYIFSILFLVGIIYYVFKKRINQIQNAATIKQRLTESEMKALRVQMNPHFIFNSLNSINSFIVENRTHQASDYIAKFSRLIRLILDNSTHEKIPLEKEIETLQLYLFLESIRFTNRFEYKIQIAENLDISSIKIPPMLIQPFVENAIWHGLLHLDRKGEVSIDIQEKNSYLQILIQDNGIGRKNAELLKSKESIHRKSYGIQITNERLLAINNLNKIIITDNISTTGEPEGTSVIIEIYFNKNMIKYT